MLFDWFKILNIWRKRQAKIKVKSMQFFVSILVLLQEWNVRVQFQSASNYMKENKLSLLSQLLEKVSTKLDSARKMNHADILVKLGHEGFPNRDFQSEAYISSSISTDAERKFIALR